MSGTLSEGGRAIGYSDSHYYGIDDKSHSWPVNPMTGGI